MTIPCLAGATTSARGNRCRILMFEIYGPRPRLLATRLGLMPKSDAFLGKLTSRTVLRPAIRLSFRTRTLAVANNLEPTIMTVMMMSMVKMVRMLSMTPFPFAMIEVVLDAPPITVLSEDNGPMSPPFEGPPMAIGIDASECGPDVFSA